MPQAKPACILDPHIISQLYTAACVCVKRWLISMSFAERTAEEVKRKHVENKEERK